MEALLDLAGKSQFQIDGCPNEKTKTKEPHIMHDTDTFDKQLNTLHS